MGLSFYSPFCFSWPFYFSCFGIYVESPHFLSSWTYFLGRPNVSRSKERFIFLSHCHRGPSGNCSAESLRSPKERETASLLGVGGQAGWGGGRGGGGRLAVAGNAACNLLLVQKKLMVASNPCIHHLHHFACTCPFTSYYRSYGCECNSVRIRTDILRGTFQG